MMLELGLSRHAYLQFRRGHEVPWHTVRHRVVGSSGATIARFAYCGARIVYYRTGLVCAPACIRCVELGVKRGLLG